MRFIKTRARALRVSSLGRQDANFERSGLRKLRADKLKAREVDGPCDRFNVTADCRRRTPTLKVGNLMFSSRSSAKGGRLRPPLCEHHGNRFGRRSRIASRLQ